MANWTIDRTINFDSYKTKEVLKALLIEPRMSDSDMEVLLHSKGVLKNENDGALRRRWFTYLRNYGLLDGDDVTEMGLLYAKDKLSVAELSLLQLIKKKIHIESSNSDIFPLKVISLLLKRLILKDLKEAYISAEEFSSIVVNTEYDNDASIDALYNDIVAKRDAGTIVPWTEHQHADIWFNTLNRTGLFDYFGRSLYVKDFDLLNRIIDFYETYSGAPISYGAFDFEFISNIPLPSKGSGSQNASELIKTKNSASILFDFFFKPYDIRKIEEKYYGKQKAYAGVISLLKIANLGETSVGLYKEFINYPNFILMKMANSTDNELVEVAKLMQTLTTNDTEEKTEIISLSKAKGAYNKIYYGAPGCGKSYYIKHDILEDSGVEESNVFRTTFHPDYANSDFIGQIMPKVNDDKSVTYEFNPGPFALALKRCYETDKMVYLVIEEINRGNASAIFGDLFQLLDRVKDSSLDNFGESEYEITNVNLQNFLEKELGSEFKNIKIPSNLTILATMNSSDQNVFTLDTAFKRRWAFEQISNDIVADASHPYKEWFVPGTNIPWAKFLKKVNEKILEFKISNSSSEDKRLGKYFVSKDCLTETAKVIGDCEMEANNFAYKVLEYLWNDVCKLNPEEMFDLSQYQTLEDLIEGFKKEQLNVFQNIDFNA